MRKRFVTLLLAPMMLVLAPTPVSASPPSIDPSTAAKIAATWLAHHVNAQGFIPQAADPNSPDLSNSAQAVLALAAAGSGRTQVDALLAYLGEHIDAYVVRTGHDDPGALAFLILGAVAGGKDPTSFGSGHVDLVTRLGATEQGSGLFGANDPTFDGAFRQGLALMALHAAGVTNTAGSNWLVGQQCADGLWTSFRADTSVACPAVDPSTFSGPDTNSTALAMLGLMAQGHTTVAGTGATALLGVRNGQGGWGFLAATDQPTDADSTGLVVAALRAVNGTHDAQGVAALLALQAGCDAAAADAGGIAFQAAPDGLVPDVLATDQAILGLSGAVLPQSAATIATDLVEPCPVAQPATTTTTTVDAVTSEPPPEAVVEATHVEAIARTGSPVAVELGLALVLIGAGLMVVQLAHDRRRRLVR